MCTYITQKMFLIFFLLFITHKNINCFKPLCSTLYIQTSNEKVDLLTGKKCTYQHVKSFFVSAK